MLEGLAHLVSSRPVGELLRDLLDIFIVAFIVYRTLLILRGTRAMQMGIGFTAFGILYAAARYFELATLGTVLSWVAPSLIIILVVVFQNDIRRALIRVGAKAWFSQGSDRQSQVIDDVVAAATELARHRMGALVAFERDANMLEFVRSEGIVIDARVSHELLVSLFVPEAVNKTHDGAVLIREDRIIRAGVFFPMPEDSRGLDPNYGSRHRAAIGIVEETDAAVVVVSEERGAITLFFANKGGAHVTLPNLSGAALRTALLGLFGREVKVGLRERLRRRRATEAVKSARSTPRKAVTSTPRPSTLRSERTRGPDTTQRLERRDGPRASETTARRVPAEDAAPTRERPARASETTARRVPAEDAAPTRERPAREPTLETRRTTATPIDVHDDDGDDARLTPSMPGVSRPMPVATAAGPAADSDPGETDTPDAPDSGRPAHARISKAMTPTDLPATARLTGDDT